MSNSLAVGKVCYRFDELPSTNDYAADLASKNKPPEGTAVRADSQSAGRGQFGSRWESEPGKNLLLSLIFYPDFLPPERQLPLSQAVALAVLDCVRDCLPAENCSVKWPNDVYVGDRKVAGILIQNSIAGSKIQHSVVGIGLNVNQLVFHSDAPNPVSLAQVAGRFFDLDALADFLFKKLEIRYLQLKNVSQNPANLHDEYCQNLYRFGQRSQFLTADDLSFLGKIRGVSEAGLLEVEIENGERRFFAPKEIRFLVPPE